MNSKNTGAARIIAIDVPLVPESKPAKLIPSTKQIIILNFLEFVAFFQSAKQKIVTPNIVTENGMGFPENNSNRPIKYFSRP